jgi:flavin-dependent dehydrogenase
MTPATAALVAEFEAAAKTAQQAEEALRKKLTQEVANLERQRAFAFRRTRLIRLLATSAAAADAEDAAVTAQRCAVRDEIGWTGESEAHRAILDRLDPVGRAVWECTREDGEGAPAAVTDELKQFEAWFEEAHKKPFYALFDQYYPEVPVVDF